MESETAQPWVWWVVAAAVPLLLTLATAFTKSTIVLGALRSALGAESLLPAPVVLALAFIVTGVVMAPVGAAVLQTVEEAGGFQSLGAASVQSWLETAQPLLEFLRQHTDADEISFFAELTALPSAHPLVLIPAFLVTELTEALAMAVFVLVPFLVVDLVVAQALVLGGLSIQSPASAALPLKVVLFLAVGGWDAVIGGLIGGYR